MPNSQLTAATAALTKAKKEAAARLKEEAEWKAEMVAVTKEEFMEFGHAVVEPGYSYYTRLYNTPGGEMCDLKAAFRGASVFDCLKLKQMSKETAELLIDDLAKFEFLEFTPELLAGLKEELPEVLRQARVPFDFSSVPGAAKYDAALARKLIRKADKAASTPSAAAAAAAADVDEGEKEDEDESDKDEGDASRTAARVIDADKWEDDPIERARRIWEWWKARVKGVSFFKYWPLALRLVVLVQPSSAFVERVFSEIKLIIEQIGVSSLEETIEARTMVRCTRFFK